MRLNPELKGRWNASSPQPPKRACTPTITFTQKIKIAHPEEQEDRRFRSGYWSSFMAGAFHDYFSLRNPLCVRSYRSWSADMKPHPTDGRRVVEKTHTLRSLDFSLQLLLWGTRDDHIPTYGKLL